MKHTAVLRAFLYYFCLLTTKDSRHCCYLLCVASNSPVEQSLIPQSIQDGLFQDPVDRINLNSRMGVSAKGGGRGEPIWNIKQNANVA